jgi:hypothetical protein
MEKDGMVALFGNDKMAPRDMRTRGTGTGLLVLAAYKAPNMFTDKVDKITFESRTIPPRIRGNIERIVRETRFRKAMQD